MRPVWVIEIQHVPGGKWHPCADAKLTKREAEKAIAFDWCRNVGCKFRATKYVPMAAAKPRRR